MQAILTPEEKVQKYKSRSRTKWYQQSKMHVLKWHCQRPDLKTIEMMQRDLKRAIWPGIPRILLKWSRFVKRNGPKSVLNIVWDWSPTTGNARFNLLLQMDVNQLLNPKAEHSFKAYSVTVYMFVQSKQKQKTCIFCAVSVEAEHLPIRESFMKTQSHFMTNLLKNMENFKCFMYSFCLL